MKAFSPFFTLHLLGLAAFGGQASAGPVISGPWTELRQAPVFEAATQPLAKNWGPALPPGQPFRVEKVYGRWLYGSPEPLPRMPKKEQAKPGWVFSRMLLAPGDKDTLSPEVATQARGVIFHSRVAWEKLGIGKPPLVSPLDFLESLTLSEGTLTAFRQQDERGLAFLPPFVPALLRRMVILKSAAAGAAPEAEPPMGLSGTDLRFLDQEFELIQEKKKAAARRRRAAQLRPPGTPALDQSARTAVLGRFMLQKYLELPPLTHEEVDGFIYMRATAMRALQGCPKEVQEYWKGRRWSHFRIYRMKSRPGVAHPWLEVALPGGYFAISGRAIELAGNEAELAFLLVRPLVREMRLKREKTTFNPKAWPGELNGLSEEAWSQTLKAQSTKDSDNLDVADEIDVDLVATECISRSGYRPMGGLSYLRKLASRRKEPWARWYSEHAIGLDYRIGRLATLVDEALASGKFPAGSASNPKRFSTASRHWNLLP
jgi:hypothetical protein